MFTGLPSIINLSQRTCVALALTLLGSPLCAIASDVISVDFIYSDTGIGPVSGDTALTAGPLANVDGLIFTGQTGAWNAITTGSNNGNNSYATAGPLLNGNGVLTTVNFTMGATGGTGGNWRGNFTTTAIPRVRNESGLSGQAESAYLYNGVLTADHYDWTISGLAPNALYDLVLFGDGSVPNNTTNIANGIAAVLDSESDWNWAMITSDALGNIVGTFTAPNPTSGITGFQLQAVPVAAPVPEPTSILL